MWMQSPVKANWVGGNYNQPLFPQNGLDKDWYCNSAFISISFQQSLRMDGSVCVCVCMCAGSARLFERDFVYKLSDVGNEREHVEAFESVDGFTVKIGESEASGNLSSRWNEVRREMEAAHLAGSIWEMNSTVFNFGTVLCQSLSHWQKVGPRSTLLCSHRVELGKNGTHLYFIFYISLLTQNDAVNVSMSVLRCTALYVWKWYAAY